MFVISAEVMKCPSSLVAPKATLSCSKTGKKESCSLTCASKAHYLAGTCFRNKFTSLLFNVRLNGIRRIEYTDK